jgi:type I restriction enzyme S subunit
MSKPAERALEAPVRQFPAYPDYKNSDIPWLGKIPEHWELGRLKRLVGFVGGGTPAKDTLEYWSGDIPWISPKDMKSKTISDTEDKITLDAVAKSATRLVPKGCVVLVVRSGILQHSIPVALNGVEAALNQDLKALIPGNRILAPYLAALIEGHQAPLLLEWKNEGATVESLELDLVKNSLLPIPSIQEQQNIVTFLDREIGKIDALVGKKQRLIQLLHEKRNALITQTVTKGLNPNVYMKDSGVEWLGKIPEHWRLSRLRLLLRSIEQGWSPSAEDREAGEDEWGVIKLSAIHRGSFNDHEHKTLPSELAPLPALEIKPGDVLLTRANTPELVGDACIVQRTRQRLMLCDLVYRLKLRDSIIDRRFLVLWLLSQIGHSQIKADARGSSLSMVKISQAHIKSWNVVVPPVPEQRAIVRFVDAEQEKIAELMKSVGEANNSLKELRTALISAAVTGKIDVRGEVA